MGTNYYHHEAAPCATCGHDANPPRHIGKSSAGWCFSLHVIPEDGINTLADWQARWAKGVIKNEYDEVVTPTEMLAVIIERAGRKGGKTDAWFHSRNHSEDGPQGLLRHQLDGRHCVGHGEGTWDYITGEFS